MSFKRQFTVILALILSLVPFCKAESKGSGWTVMIYMIGSDLETYSGTAVKDINEMQQSLRTDTQLILLTGGARKWHNELDAASPMLSALTPNGLIPIRSLNSCMGDKETLKALVQEGLSTANSDKVALVFWDHGYGPIEGFGNDITNPDDRRLSLNEIAKALEECDCRKQKLSLIGFDACFMAGCETAFMLAPYADYLLASQEIVPDYGWDYGFLSTLDTSCSTREMGLSVMNAYQENCEENNKLSLSKHPYTLSLVKLDEMNGLTQALKDLFGDLSVIIKENDLASVSSVRQEKWGLGRYSNESEYDFIDLFELATSCKDLSVNAERVIKALDGCIVDCVGDTDSVMHAHGLSIYFPQFADMNRMTTRQQKLADLPLPDAWKRFILDYPMAIKAAETIDNEVVAKAANGVYTVELSEAERFVFNRLKYFVYAGTPEEGLRLVYAGNDYVLDESTASINYEKQCLMISNGTDSCVLPALMIQNDGTIKRYLAEAIAYSQIENEYGFYDFSTHTTNLVFEYHFDNESWSMPALFELGADDLMSGKQTLKLENIYEFVFTNQFYLPIYGQNNRPQPFYHWQAINVFDYYSLSLVETKEDGTMAPLRPSVSTSSLPDDEHYYIQLIVVDNYGNERASELISIE